MMEMTDQLIKTAPTLADRRARREAIIALVARYGAYNVRVFGSVARGDATSESDIDLLVNFHEGARYYDHVGFWQDLQELLGRNVDVMSDHARMRERLRNRIMRDVVPL